MKSSVTAIVLTLVLASLARGQTAPASDAAAASKQGRTQKEKDDSSYLRILRDKNDDPIALQTSIVSFTYREEGKPSVVVDLIGAVHVADTAYFKQLNQLFTQYDALLYELVAPEDNNVPAGGTSRHPVGQMQQGMKSMLDLAYQLEEVDYTKKNFVHADMSPEEFSRIMSQRGESFAQMLLKMMGAALAMQKSDGRGSDTDILFAFFAKDREKRLKRVLSTQFGNLEGTMGVLEGEEGSTIIGQRNKKALEVLRRELENGKKRIGIFYGAGHLPDMEERLAEEFGLYPDKKSIKWLTAWDMK